VVWWNPNQCKIAREERKEGKEKLGLSSSHLPLLPLLNLDPPALPQYDLDALSHPPNETPYGASA
jgi:hypothetical protein